MSDNRELVTNNVRLENASFAVNLGNLEISLNNILFEYCSCMSSLREKSKIYLKDCWQSSCGTSRCHFKS